MSVPELDVSLESLQKLTAVAIEKERTRIDEDDKMNVEKQITAWITKLMPHLKSQIAAAAARGVCSMMVYDVPEYITTSAIGSYFPGLTITKEDHDSFMKTYRMRIRWLNDPSGSPASKWEASFIDPYYEPEEVGGRSSLFDDENDW